MITAAAEEEEERLTGFEANLFPPFPISGRIAAAARIPRVHNISSYSISWESVWLQVLQCRAVMQQRSVDGAAAVGMLAADC